jgi:hypothetical protein
VDNERKSILVLEDNERRVELMRKALASLPVDLELVVWDNARTMSKDLPKWLLKASIISLDFDLGDSTTRDPGTGMDMIQTLGRCVSSCPVLVHTSLEQEGKAMVRELRRHGWTTKMVRFSSREAALPWRDAVEDMVCGDDSV